jgi:hypothetical protein
VGVVVIRSVLAALGFVGIAAAAVIFADPALAERIPRPGPAPLLGVGLPLLGGVLGTMLLVRRYRRKD